MIIQIEGDAKKIKQLIKELRPRCKRDKVVLSFKEDIKQVQKSKKIK